MYIFEPSVYKLVATSLVPDALANDISSSKSAYSTQLSGRVKNSNLFNQKEPPAK